MLSLFMEGQKVMGIHRYAIARQRLNVCEYRHLLLSNTFQRKQGLDRFKKKSNYYCSLCDKPCPAESGFFLPPLYIDIQIMLGQTKCLCLLKGWPRHMPEGGWIMPACLSALLYLRLFQQLLKGKKKLCDAVAGHLNGKCGRVAEHSRIILKLKRPE